MRSKQDKLKIFDMWGKPDTLNTVQISEANKNILKRLRFKHVTLNEIRYTEHTSRFVW